MTTSDGRRLEHELRARNPWRSKTLAYASFSDAVECTMDLQKFALPAAAFAIGAILGRVLGLKPLIRGAMTAAAVTGIGTAQPTLLGSDRRSGTRRRRGATTRAARKKTPHKRSPRVSAHE
jgi:hypothetical protein